ncbi:MAG TPA: hypothetical protein K8V56_02040, partial [Sporosarcina psychrophila]|nr:hypothetical protein [Sporosarcina psychrophila]
ISAPEIIAAHVDSNGTAHPNLKSRLDNFEVSATQQLQQKADQSFVDSQLSAIVSGAPKGTYTDLASLQTAYPDGAEGIFLVLSDGHWYYWNDMTNAWTDGGIYQATTSNDFPATNDAVNGNFSNSISGWGQAGGQLSAADNELTYKVVSLSATARIERNVDDAVPTHKYYMKLDILPKYSTTTYFQIGDSVNDNATLTPNVWNRYSRIATAISNTRFRLYHRTNASYAVNDTFKVKDVMIIDLTKTFGAGSEPDVTEMDRIMSKYPNLFFEGSVGTLLTNKDLYEDFTSYLTTENKEWVV